MDGHIWDGGFGRSLLFGATASTEWVTHGHTTDDDVCSPIKHSHTYMNPTANNVLPIKLNARRSVFNRYPKQMRSLHIYKVTKTIIVMPKFSLDNGLE